MPMLSFCHIMYYKLCSNNVSLYPGFKRDRNKVVKSLPMKPILKYCLWFCFCRTGTDAPDMDDEQDQQERRLRSAFAQQLVFSTIFE